MLRYVIAAVLAASTLLMAALAVLQHRHGRMTGTVLASVLGGGTTTLVCAGALALP